ncbi:DUF6881 domain-containing protein, partial [Leptospira interrogans]|uniref:DUF6881 domain-containing protein n=2 Tax=Leptospiraceae TaxID=170 RepID=UPI001E2BD762
MEYLKVRWLHNHLDEPIELYSELDITEKLLPTVFENYLSVSLNYAPILFSELFGLIDSRV